MNFYYPPVLAIDPGSTQSGYVCWSPSTGFSALDRVPTRTIPHFGKIDNHKLLEIIQWCEWDIVIEKITLYQKADQNIHDTIWWYGRFSQVAEDRPQNHVLRFMSRSDVKKSLLPGLKTTERNDTTVKAYLKDRFAPGVSNHGKGTKSAPGYFYGFKADVWQAFALAVAYHDEISEGMAGRLVA